MTETTKKFKLLLPTRDFIFRKMFSEPENMPLLQDLLKSILDISPEEYEKLEIMDPRLDKDYEEDKQGVLDLKIYMKTGKRVDVEIQVKKFFHLEQRSVFYSSKLITEQIGSGDDYDSIKQVIVIWILGHDYLPEEGYHNVSDSRIRRSGRNWPTLQQTHILELPKVPKENDGTRLWQWMQFFKAEREEEFEMLAQQDETIKKAVMVIRKLSQDEEMQLLEERREKARRDWNDWHAWDMHEAREEGFRLKAEQTAKKALLAGLGLELIEELSGLSKEEIAQLSF